MDCHSTLSEDLDGLPDYLYDVLRVQLVEDAIRSQNYEVVIGLDFKMLNLRLGNDYLAVASEALVFRFNVSEGTSHR